MDLKVLIFDIETAPCIGYLWGLWQEVRSTDFIKQEWYVICWAAKWMDEKKVHSAYSQTNDDYKCVYALWKLLDEADVVIAHNGKKFDVKKINTRFIMNGLMPPSPYKVIDTLTEARKYFKFTSNRLNDLGQYLKVGKKIDTGGFELWEKCIKGQKTALKKMVRYCKQDVRLLERVYKKLRGYMSTHPNIAVMKMGLNCPNCSSKDIIARGRATTNVCVYQRYSCKDCGRWFRGHRI